MLLFVGQKLFDIHLNIVARNSSFLFKVISQHNKQKLIFDMIIQLREVGVQ